MNETIRIRKVAIEDPALQVQIEQFQAADNRPSFTNATVALVIAGLESKRQQPPAIDPLRPGTAA